MQGLKMLVILVFNVRVPFLPTQCREVVLEVACCIKL